MIAPKHIVEYATLLLFGSLLRLLPLRLALALGWLIALLMHHLIRFRRAEARRRIRLVLGTAPTQTDINRIAWISWRNLCFNAVEAIRFGRLSADTFHQNPHFQPALDQLANALQQSPSGLIVPTIHMGNWDLAGIATDLHGLPIFTIARRQKNPLTDAYLNRARNHFNMEVLLNDENVLKQIIRRLRNGHLFALLPDVRNPRPVQTIPFLGSTANLGSGAALFARQCNAPIQPAITRRIGWTQHQLTLLTPIHSDPNADKKADQQRIMEQLMEQFTAEINRTPEQYFWYNKRWVLDPI